MRKDVEMSGAARLEFLGAIEQLKEWVTTIPNPSATHYCTECVKFDLKTEKCSLYDARPPATTIVQGCDEWDLDIPF